MNDYPENLIDIQLHIGDDYQTSWTADRAHYYGTNGTPTTWFDGVDEAAGAFTQDQEMYLWYKAKVTNAMEVPTDTRVELEAVQTADQTWTLTAHVTIDPDGSARELTGHVAQVIDYYPPEDDDSFRNCVIQAVDVPGLTLEPGTTLDFNVDMTLSGDSWNYKENVKFVAWVQDKGLSGPKAVHNAAQLAWPFTEDVEPTCSLAQSSEGSASNLFYLLVLLYPVFLTRNRRKP